MIHYINCSLDAIVLKSCSFTASVQMYTSQFWLPNKDNALVFKTHYLKTPDWQDCLKVSLK